MAKLLPLAALPALAALLALLPSGPGVADEKPAKHGVVVSVSPPANEVGRQVLADGGNAVDAAVAVGFALGFATTVAEPDVLVLARQVEAASDGAIGAFGLTYVIAAGVGIFAALALVRILTRISIAHLLAGVYAVMILLSWLAPVEIIPLAYDAGSVTTGVLTAPVVLALALGLASVLGGRSAVEDGFGLLGLASAGPILVVLLLGLFL